MSPRRPTPPAGPPSRSLADDLRLSDDDRLGTLLRLRPDLLHPVPPDLTTLVARASTSVSTARALDRLDEWSLQVLEVLAALDEPCHRDALGAVLPGAPAERVGEALRALVDLALVWGDDELHLVRAAREAVGPWPCGLHPAGLPHPDPASVRALVDSAPAEVTAVLDQLLWGPPVGSLPHARRTVTARTARTPVEWLLARGLLVPRGDDTVALPREVALALRGGAFLREPRPEPPASDAAGGPRGQARDADPEAGQLALTAVRWVEELLERWSLTPPSQLRAGGLGVRELTAAARQLEVEEAVALLLVEVAHAAGLLSSDEEEQPRWLPTQAYDLWLARDPAERWAALAAAWLAMPRAPVLASGSEKVNALSAGLERVDAPAVRRLALDALAGAGGPTDAEAVLERVNWHRPRRRGPLRDLMVRAALEEAAVLGVVVGGVLTTPGRALITSASPAEAIRPLMPEPLDHVLLQADLTAVAPGPLESTLARELALLADVESRGAATVYRFTPTSLRRAFDAGRSAHEVLDLLRARSRTPVPQPLTYLVEDIARRHGVVRVGVASSYVRCDDEATVSAVLADRRSARLGPVRLAPGVLALQVGVDEALAALRELGLAPAAEAPDGTVVLRRPDSRRAPVRRRRPAVPPTEPSAPDALLVSAAVRALRAGDRVADRASAGPVRLGRIPVTTPADTIAAIRAVIESEGSLWIGYADTDGRATEHLIDPVEVSRGFLTAYDHRYEEVRSFALARVTGAAPYEGSST